MCSDTDVDVDVVSVLDVASLNDDAGGMLMLVMVLFLVPVMLVMIDTVLVDST